MTGPSNTGKRKAVPKTTETVTGIEGYSDIVEVKKEHAIDLAVSDGVGREFLVFEPCLCATPATPWGRSWWESPLRAPPYGTQIRSIRYRAES